MFPITEERKNNKKNNLTTTIEIHKFRVLVMTVSTFTYASSRGIDELPYIVATTPLTILQDKVVVGNFDLH